MGLLGTLFGKNTKVQHKEKLIEHTLTTIDMMIEKIEQIRKDPNIPDAQKEDQIRLLEHEIRKFAEGMGIPYDK